MYIIRAKVLTNSSEDKYARVSLQAEDVWEKSPLICSVGAIPLHVDDYVFVQLEDDASQPLILGRALGDYQKYSVEPNGSVLFDSSDGNNWTVGFVNNDILTIVNSAGTKIEINSSNINITLGKLTITGALHVDGTVQPNSLGGFCAIKYCPFTGAPHTGNEIR